MRYLYGDSSSFPLNQNFVLTLASATDCAVRLLEVEARIGEAQQISEDADVAAAAETADIDQLERRVGKALSQREHLSNATAKVAEQVVAASSAQFARARVGVKSWREETVRQAFEGCGPAAVMAPINQFMVRHELPYTAWGLRWKAGVGDEPVQAQVYAIMQRGLTATLSVAIPPKHPWAQPVRVSSLERQLIIRLMGKSWLGRPKLKDEHLERYYVTRITRTNERHALVLSKRAKEPSDGMLITLRDSDVKRITVTRLDRDDNPVGEPAALDGVDGQMIKRLWRRIEETIADLIDHRYQLLAATLYGKRVTELDSPAPVATAIIQSIAPLVRDLQRHSRTPGELQLKRDLGDGRREELFISNDDVIRKYARLSPDHRRLFECYGLEAATPAMPHTRHNDAHTEVLPDPRPSRPVPLEIRARSEAPPLSSPRQLLDALEAETMFATPRSSPLALPASGHRGAITQSPPPYIPASHSPTMANSSRPPATSYVAPAGRHTAVNVPPPPALPSALPPPSQPPRRRGQPQVLTSAPPLSALPHPSLPPPPRQPLRRASTPPHLRVVNG